MKDIQKKNSLNKKSKSKKGITFHAVGMLAVSCCMAAPVMAESIVSETLYITARQKGEFDNREQIKARREVDNVVEGNYDQQQKRGFSMRR